MREEQGTAPGGRSTAERVTLRDSDWPPERNAAGVRAFLAGHVDHLASSPSSALLLAFKTGASALTALSRGEDPKRQRQRLRNAVGAINRMTRGRPLPRPEVLPEAGSGARAQSRDL